MVAAILLRWIFHVELMDVKLGRARLMQPPALPEYGPRLRSRWQRPARPMAPDSPSAYAKASSNWIDRRQRAREQRYPRDSPESHTAHRTRTMHSSSLAAYRAGL